MLWSRYGPRESNVSRGDIAPMVGLAVPPRALQARGATMPDGAWR
jgi:hypothetical protein